MVKSKPCKHLLPITKCEVCHKEYVREYRQRPDIKQHRREHYKKYYQIPEVKRHMREYSKQYYQRPEVKQHIKEYYQRPEVKKYRKQYYKREEIKQYMREYYKRPEVKQHMKEKNSLFNNKRQIKDLIKHYTKELKKINDEIKKKWYIPPIALQGKQIQLQNLIDNLQMIIKHTEPMPQKQRVEARQRMLNELMTTDGKIVSMRKPLESG